MKEKFSFLWMVIIAAGLFISCTKINPEITYNESIPAPKVSGPLNKISGIKPIAFSGTCDKRITALEISFDQGANWHNLTSLDNAAVIDCKFNEKFSCNFAINESNFGASTSQFTNLQGLIRGLGDFGISELGLFDVKNTRDLKRTVLLGQGKSSNANSTLTSRITPTTTSQSSNGSYTLKSKLIY